MKSSLIIGIFFKDEPSAIKGIQQLEMKHRQRYVALESSNGYLVITEDYARRKWPSQF